MAVQTEYQVLDPAALTNEALGALHAQGYGADARLIVFVRHVQATGDGRQATEEPVPQATEEPAGPESVATADGQGAG